MPWRAVDHGAEALEAFVTKTREKAAALKFIKKALKRHGSTKVIGADGLSDRKAATWRRGAFGKRTVVQL